MGSNTPLRLFQSRIWIFFAVVYFLAGTAAASSEAELAAAASVDHTALTVGGVFVEIVSTLAVLLVAGRVTGRTRRSDAPTDLEAANSARLEGLQKKRQKTASNFGQLAQARQQSACSRAQQSNATPSQPPVVSNPPALRVSPDTIDYQDRFVR